MVNGKVKWFSNKKRYGIIGQEEGPDVFVHFSGILDERFKSLNEGDEVSFDIEEDDKDLKAVNVNAL